MKELLFPICYAPRFTGLVFFVFDFTREVRTAVERPLLGLWGDILVSMVVSAMLAYIVYRGALAVRPETMPNAG